MFDAKKVMAIAEELRGATACRGGVRTVVRTVLAIVAIGWVCGLTGCASLDTSDSFVTRWNMRGAGALGSFVLHEACHLAVGAAFGADVGASFRGSSLYLEFGDLSQNEHQTVSIIGNVCTGIAAEVIVDTGAHRKSNLAWGAAAFHAINVFGYAWSPSGDAEYWEKSGGSKASWQAINATHSTRIGAQLAWDSRFGDYLKERWRMGPIGPSPVFGVSAALPASVPEPNPLSESSAPESERVLHVFESLTVPVALTASTD